MFSKIHVFSRAPNTAASINKTSRKAFTVNKSSGIIICAQWATSFHHSSTLDQTKHQWSTWQTATLCFPRWPLHRWPEGADEAISELPLHFVQGHHDLWQWQALVVGSWDTYDQTHWHSESLKTRHLNITKRQAIGSTAGIPCNAMCTIL